MAISIASKRAEPLQSLQNGNTLDIGHHIIDLEKHKLSLFKSAYEKASMYTRSSSLEASVHVAEFCASQNITELFTADTIQEKEVASSMKLLQSNAYPIVPFMKPSLVLHRPFVHLDPNALRYLSDHDVPACDLRPSLWMDDIESAYQGNMGIFIMNTVNGTQIC